jgi:hypothetical protein
MEFIDLKSTDFVMNNNFLLFPKKKVKTIKFLRLLNVYPLRLPWFGQEYLSHHRK